MTRRPFATADPAEIAGMSSPVRCSFCRGIYDLGTVEVTARYTDCSMWKTPCCGTVADDRGETGWKPNRDYIPVKEGRLGVDIYGREAWV